MKTVNNFIVVILATVFTTQTGLSLPRHLTRDVRVESNKEKIKKEELPDAAMETLNSSAYKDWSIVQAYRIKSKDAQGKEVIQFEVELKKDNNTQIVKLDKDGNKK